MAAGYYISGAAHLGTILYLMVGPAFFVREKPPVQTEVSVMSGAEFAALLAARETAAAAPPVDHSVEAVPTLQAPLNEPGETPTDEATAAENEPVPPEEVIPSTRPPIARPILADRVAPQPTPAPEQPAEAAPVPAIATAPSEEPSEVVAEQEEAAAPQEAGQEIRTEADEEEIEPEIVSLRPISRPDNLQILREPAPAEPREASSAPSLAEPQVDLASSIDSALNEALAGIEQSSQQAAAPVSLGERQGLQLLIADCWQLGAVSTDTFETRVVLGVEFTQSGDVVPGSIRVVSVEGPSESARRTATDRAQGALAEWGRRRCGPERFPLPPEKYEQWRQLELVFDPRNMGFR